MQRRNTRLHDRTTSGAIVKLRWQGASGEAHFARGKVVNRSDNGLCVELVEPIRPLSYVTLDTPELQKDWAGGGPVRYCWRKGSRYMIGLELKTGARWQ
jgi:hypothetical protein